MNDLLHEFTTEVGDEDGHPYLARAMGRQRKGATVWEGWLEFSPRGGGGIVRKSPIETTQPNREALVYWASGLEPVYLEGALERAITARSERRGLGHIFGLQSFDLRFDLNCQEVTLASAADHVEEARLFVVPNLAHECTVQRRAARLARSGKSFGAVHDGPHRHRECQASVAHLDGWVTDRLARSAHRHLTGEALREILDELIGLALDPRLSEFAESSHDREVRTDPELRLGLFLREREVQRRADRAADARVLRIRADRGGTGHFVARDDREITIKDETDGADLDRERPLVAILPIGAHRCDARNAPRGSRNVHEPCPDFVFGRCDHRGVRELHSLDVNPAAWSVPSTR